MTSHGHPHRNKPEGDALGWFLAISPAIAAVLIAVVMLSINSSATQWHATIIVSAAFTLLWILLVPVDVYTWASPRYRELGKEPTYFVGWWTIGMVLLAWPVFLVYSRQRRKLGAPSRLAPTLICFAFMLTMFIVSASEARGVHDASPTEAIQQAPVSLQSLDELRKSGDKDDFVAELCKRMWAVDVKTLKGKKVTMISPKDTAAPLFAVKSSGMTFKPVVFVVKTSSGRTAVRFTYMCLYTSDKPCHADRMEIIAGDSHESFGADSKGFDHSCRQTSPGMYLDSVQSYIDWDALRAMHDASQWMIVLAGPQSGYSDVVDGDALRVLKTLIEIDRIVDIGVDSGIDMYDLTRSANLNASCH